MTLKPFRRNDFLTILFLYRNANQYNYLYFVTTEKRPRGFYVCSERQIESEITILIHSKK